MANKKYDNEDGVWRTIGGRRVFIKNGQSLADAMKESGKFKSAKKKPEYGSPEERKEYFAKSDEEKAEIFNKQMDKKNAKVKAKEEGKKIEYFNGDTILDELGSDAEGVSALYEKLGFDGEEIWDKVVEDAEYGNLYKVEKDGKSYIELKRDDQTLTYNGRASDNTPIINGGEKEESKKELTQSQAGDPYDDPESEESQRLQDIQSRYDEYLQQTEGRGASYGELAHIEGLRGKELDDFESELDKWEFGVGKDNQQLEDERKERHYKEKKDFYERALKKAQNDKDKENEERAKDNLGFVNEKLEEIGKNNKEKYGIKLRNEKEKPMNEQFEVNGKAEPEGPELDEYDREKLEGLIGNGIPQDAYDEFVDITGEEPQAINNAIGQLADDLTGYEELNDFEDEYGAISDYDRLDNLYEDLNTYLDDKIDEGEIDESFKDDVINYFGDAEDTANSQMDEEIQSYLDKASGGKKEADEQAKMDEINRRIADHLANVSKVAKDLGDEKNARTYDLGSQYARDQIKGSGESPKEEKYDLNKKLSADDISSIAVITNSINDQYGYGFSKMLDEAEREGKKVKDVYVNGQNGRARVDFEDGARIDFYDLEKGGATITNTKNTNDFEKYQKALNSYRVHKNEDVSYDFNNGGWINNNENTSIKGLNNSKYDAKYGNKESAPTTDDRTKEQRQFDLTKSMAKMYDVDRKTAEHYRYSPQDLSHDKKYGGMGKYDENEWNDRPTAKTGAEAMNQAIRSKASKTSKTQKVTAGDESNKSINDSIREKAGKKKKETESALPQYKPITEQGNSNRKQVRENIQAHIMEHYTPDYTGDDSISPQEAFVRQMEAMGESNMWRAGKKIAEGGSYLVYNGDMEDFLNDLKINPKGKKFSSDKAFDMYTSLIGRESARLYEKYKKNLKK